MNHFWLRVTILKGRFQRAYSQSNEYVKATLPTVYIESSIASSQYLPWFGIKPIQAAVTSPQKRVNNFRLRVRKLKRG